MYRLTGNALLTKMGEKVLKKERRGLFYKNRLFILQLLTLAQKN